MRLPQQKYDWLQEELDSFTILFNVLRSQVDGLDSN